MTLSDFTGLITAANVVDLIQLLAIVFGGIIAAMLLLAPLLFAKRGFNYILSKVSSAIGS